jgi:hypothetical protein
VQLDRVRRRAHRTAGLGERELRVVDEVLDPLHGGTRRHPVEQPRRPVEPENVDLPAQEADRGAVLERVHVAEVGAYERVLQLPVQRVDERLHLLRHPRGDPTLCRLELERRAVQHPAQVGEEAFGNRDDGDDLAIPQLALRLGAREPDEGDVLSHAVNRRVDVEPPPRQVHVTRKALLVDERNSGLGARVPGDEADQERNHDRIRDQDRKQRR